MEMNKEWVITLYKDTKARYHAKGLQVCKKIVNTYSDGYTTIAYMYGNFNIGEKRVEQEWPLKELNIEWINFVQEYKLTLIQKMLKKFFKKKYPETIKVRPNDGTIVIMGYRAEHYEVAEYDNKCWITDLSFPSEPKQWAYVPKECIDAAEKLINRNDTLTT